MKTKKLNKIQIIAAILALSLTIVLVACGKDEKVIRSTTEFDIAYDTSRYIYFEIEMETGEIIGGQLEPLAAPITVRNFITLAESGYYNGKTFNYVVPDKVIMCSTPEEDPPYTIYGEFSNNGWHNSIGHQRGILSMGRDDDDYNSAYGSFFVLLETRAYYNGDYAAFGEITKGLGTLDKFSNVEANGSTPVDELVIKEIRITGN